MGYACISRKILLEASEEYNIPEIKIIRAIEDAPSILDRLTRQKEKFVTYIRAALLKHVQKDNMVYHGLFGHFFLQDIPHVLEVRIVGDLEARVADEGLWLATAIGGNVITCTSFGYPLGERASYST